MPVVNRFAAEGCSVLEAERRAVLIAIGVLILWAVMGIGAQAIHACLLPEPHHTVLVPDPGCSVRCDSMLSPVPACAAGFSRTLLPA